MRRLGIAFGVCAVLAAVASTGSFALDEQRGPVPVAPAADGVKAQVQDQAAAKPDAGTEIRIPGLGKLGTLPKMDFGLELLYGAADNGQQMQLQEPQNNGSEDQDLMIRGSVKHRF